MTSTKKDSGRFVAHSDNGNESQAADSFGIVEGCLTKDYIEALWLCTINFNHNYTLQMVYSYQGDLQEVPCATKQLSPTRTTLHTVYTIHSFAPMNVMYNII